MLAIGRERRWKLPQEYSVVQYILIISKEIKIEDALHKMFPRRKSISCYCALANEVLVADIK